MGKKKNHPADQIPITAIFPIYANTTTLMNLLDLSITAVHDLLAEAAAAGVEVIRPTSRPLVNLVEFHDYLQRFRVVQETQLKVASG